ncbi:MAG: ribonuclease P protein component [Acidobacteria bacterium]|nr:ribonuclease P protein component [Acidobacteriota bacterium]
MAAPLAGVRPSQGLPRSGRIQKRADFLQAYENGAKTHGRFVVVFVRGNDRDESRMGVTVTKKVGKAVARNRAKRWVREVYRRARLQAPLAGKRIDIVVNVKPSAVDAPYREFAADLARALERAAARSEQT